MKIAWKALLILLFLCGAGLLLSGYDDLAKFGCLQTSPPEDGEQVPECVLHNAKSLPNIDTPVVNPQEQALKALLLDQAQKDAWTAEELAALTAHLNDPAARFLSPVLEVNVTHVETAAQYEHHLEQKSLELCRSFWLFNQARLDSVVAPYGVPASVVAAILKVESNFGNWIGNHNTFNVYWSLALGDQSAVVDSLFSQDDPERDAKVRKLAMRARWARKQLQDLIYMSRHGGLDPLRIHGSWAGAFGWAQFIPASYRAYGRDGNGDGVVDPDNLDDSAASIACYLKMNGWKSKGDRRHEMKVIKRYNHSEHYAECVLNLAELMRGFNG